MISTLRRLRVLHIVASNQRRGAEVFALDLTGAMQEVDHAVVYLRAAREPTVTFSCPTRCLRMSSGPVGFIRAVRSLKAAAAQMQAEVLQAHGGEALRIAVLSGLGRGSPVAYRRIGVAPTAMTRGWKLHWHRWLMSRAAAVVCVSEAVREQSLELFGLDPGRTLTVPNAVDPARLRAAGATSTSTLDALDVPLEGRVILSIGSLSWEKDPLGALTVTAELLTHDRRLRHLFVGDGPLRTQLVQLADKLGVAEQVLVTGASDDVGSVLAAADVVLFASRPDGMEGMPATLIEAGLAGRPVVAFRIAGVSEVVVDGVTGLLVKAGDKVGLRGAIGELLEDPVRAAALGAAAASRCAEHFTIDVVAPAYQSLWEGLIPRPAD